LKFAIGLSASNTKLIHNFELLALKAHAIGHQNIFNTLFADMNVGLCMDSLIPTFHLRQMSSCNSTTALGGNGNSDFGTRGAQVNLCIANFHPLLFEADIFADRGIGTVADGAFDSLASVGIIRFLH